MPDAIGDLVMAYKSGRGYYATFAVGNLQFGIIIGDYRRPYRDDPAPRRDLVAASQLSSPRRA